MVRSSSSSKSKALLNVTTKRKNPFSPYGFHIIMAVVAAVILVGGYLFYYFQEQQMRQRIEGGLLVMAQLKAEQISDWRAERLNDANILVGSPFFAEGVERYIASPTDTETRDKILARLAIITQAYPYQDILLTDANGNILLSLNNSVNRLSNMTLAQVPDAIKERKAVMTDLYSAPDSNSPQLDVIAPLFPWGQNPPQAIGTVVLCIDPSQYLYPLLQSSPVPSQTSETLLVERDGDHVLYLNELRYQEDAALKLRIPLSQQEVPAVMAIQGKEGVFEGKDYRGVGVLSALQHISDSPWYIVAKIDISEALAPWRSRGGLIIAVMAGLLAATLAVVGLIWQRRRRQEYQALYQAEAGKKKLEQDLINSEAKYRRLFETAQDAILILDGETGQIMDANPFIKDMLGYTLMELHGKHLWEIGTFRDIVASKAAFEELKEKGYIRYEHLPLQTRDGRQIHVEFVSNKYKVDSMEVFQCNIRDITERKKMEDLVKENESRFRSIVETTREWIWRMDLDGKMTYNNPAFEEILGYNQEELLGRNTLDYMHEDDRLGIEQMLQQLIPEKRGWTNLVVRWHHKDGTLRWLESNAVPILNSEGQMLGYQGADRDITERKKAEEALYESEERYRTILEQMKDSYYEVDLAGNFTFVNDALCRRLGHSREELIGMNYRAYTPEERADNTFKTFNQVFRTGQPIIAYPSVAMAKDGSLIFTERSIFPLQNEEGKTIGFRGISRDITERIRAEEAVKQSEEKYRTILNEIYEVYYEIDLNGNYTFFNDALCHRMGYSREELMGMNYREYTPKEDWKSDAAKFRGVYETGEPLRWVPLRNITRDGRILYLEDTVLPMRNEKDEVIGFRGLSRDVTERKLAEEERRQLELKSQITSRLASVGEMAAGVAHEINNPLTGITGYAQLLMDRKDLPPDIRSDLAAINEGAQRVAGIVQRLLAFSRQTRPQRKLVEINDLIDSTLVLRAYHLRVNNIEVIKRLMPDLLETVVDPGQIQQVLLNLIVNAETEMKLAHGKGKLTITTEKRDNFIKIYVKDNGPGIKPEVMDKIFDPFFTTREVGQGTGLGLSLCYGIVAEHNGRIYAESKPGKGATFIVELPVITEVIPPEPAEPVIVESKKKIKARILAVDDEKVVRDVVKRVLSGGGHKVETVDNAADALNRIESHRYDLVLVDIKMPGMNGVELYKRIQKINKPLARRVVFITGDVMGADTEKFLAETKSDHIEKPFNAEQLEKAVRRALSGGTL